MGVKRATAKPAPIMDVYDSKYPRFKANLVLLVGLQTGRSRAGQMLDLDPELIFYGLDPDPGPDPDPIGTMNIV